MMIDKERATRVGDLAANLFEHDAVARLWLKAKARYNADIERLHAEAWWQNIQIIRAHRLAKGWGPRHDQRVKQRHRRKVRMARKRRRGYA
jgi:hypothetical protein